MAVKREENPAGSSNNLRGDVLRVLGVLTDGFASVQAEDIELRLVATEIQVRRPSAARGGGRASVLTQLSQNATVTSTTTEWGRTTAMSAGIRRCVDSPAVLPALLATRPARRCRPRQAGFRC